MPAVPADTADLDGDGNTTERTPYDLDGKPRFVDDLFTPDTGVPGSPVVDMGAYEFQLPDCNHNGNDDRCDLNCGPYCPPPCGTSADCNHNGVPDECEPDCNANGIADECDIAACPDRVCVGGVIPGASCTTDVDCFPGGICALYWAGGCQDCNSNGIPDGCDIAAGTSLDANLNGIPDECILSGAGVNWSDPIWGLPTPAPYPDNINPNASHDWHVTPLTPIDLFLDVTVQIDSLHLLNGSTLRVTQTGAVDLTIKSPGNMVIEGNLYVAHDRVISVPGGTVTVNPGGVYMKDPSTAAARGGTASAAIFPAGLTLNSCAPPCVIRSAVDLTQFMSATVNGDLKIDGVLAANGSCESSFEGGVAGGYTPPIVRVKDHASIGILGNLVLMGAANVIVDPIVDPIDPHMTPVTISVDFDNQSMRPDCFSCRHGGFLFNGSSEQHFEVGSTDVGPVGSVTGREFVIGAVEVATGSKVKFRNDFDNNGLGQASCEEALYVEKLTLKASSTIILVVQHIVICG